MDLYAVENWSIPLGAIEILYFPCMPLFEICVPLNPIDLNSTPNRYGRVGDERQNTLENVNFAPPLLW